MDSAYRAHRAGIETNETDWRLQAALINFLESKWEEPDEGIWEVRGGRRQFTHSKMMAWVAFDRAVKLIERCDCAGEIISNAGEKSATKFTGKSAPRDITRRKKRLPRFTDRRNSMRACS